MARWCVAFNVYIFRREWQLRAVLKEISLNGDECSARVSIITKKMLFFVIAVLSSTLQRRQRSSLEFCETQPEKGLMLVLKLWI